jgi:hypothetical protein
MFEVAAKLRRIAIVMSMVSLTALAAWAATAVNVTANLTSTCLNCQTDRSGMYSLLPDGSSPYSPFTDSRIQSQILTNNSVYTLDTTNTLVNGLVVGGTRTVDMHFYSPVECKPPYISCTPPDSYPNNILPPCWGGNYDQDQAVNWSVFAPTSFLRMKTDVPYQGMARVNFNVRTACDKQVNRFRLEWGAVCIVRTATGWTITSDVCGAQTNYGEAHLQAYGGTKKNTVDYGDWRMPFQLMLTK